MSLNLWSLALLMFVVSCGDHGVNQPSEPRVVGGAETAAHPEIGRGLASGCTATLIHERYFLTAAHCLRGYTDTTVDENDTFQTETEDGATMAVAVDRAYSFARVRHEPTLQLDMTSDLALARLKVPVSASTATPASLSDTLPSPGDRVTLFGYGCTDRVNPVGAGVKRYLSFAFGSPTQALCFGDSGGPAVRGEVNERGAVWGVNSDYVGTGSFDTWNDVFADVPGLKAQIHAVIAAWEGPMTTPGVDFPGGDFAAFTVSPSNVVACSRACIDRPGCRAYTYAEHGSYGVCRIKQFVAGWRPCESCYGSIAPGWEIRIDRPGSDYAYYELAENRPDLCRASCATDEACTAFTFVLPRDGRPGGCWLKNAVPGTAAKDDVVSGVRRGRENNTDRVGTDLAWRATGSVAACERECAQEARCHAYTFRQETTASGTCWLKTHATAPSWAAGLVSGVKRGQEIDTDRMGGDYRSFDIDGARPEECQAACAADAPCRAWTFSRGNAQAKPHCWLKSSVPAARAARGLISGIKGTEFF